jgi:hypothetical protein
MGNPQKPPTFWTVRNFLLFRFWSQIPETCPQLPKLTFHEEIQQWKVIENNVSVWNTQIVPELWKNIGKLCGFQESSKMLKIVVFYNFQAIEISHYFLNFSPKIFKFWDFQKTIQFPIIFTIKKLFRKNSSKLKKIEISWRKGATNLPWFQVFRLWGLLCLEVLIKRHVSSSIV